MFTQVKQHSLTRRNSKLMVELVIGVIGLLGIMLAQIDSNHSQINNNLLDNDKTIISETVTRVATKIVWLDILF